MESSQNRFQPVLAIDLLGTASKMHSINKHFCYTATLDTSFILSPFIPLKWIKIRVEMLGDSFTTLCDSQDQILESLGG